MNVKKSFGLNFIKAGTAIAVILSLSVIGMFAPRHFGSTASALDCANVEEIPSIATFNPFQVGQNSDGSYSTVNGSNCLDQPTLSVKPQGSSLYYPSANANTGDTLTVSAYVHNGARQDLTPQNLDEAFNITATFTVDTTSGSSHSISVVLNGQDINGNPMQAKSGNITINTPAGASLQVNSGSGVIEDHLSNFLNSAQIGTSNFTVSLGSQMACFEYSRFVNFTVTVVGGQQQQNSSGSINAQMNAQPSNACTTNLLDATVSWQTQNVSNAVVTVTNPALDKNNYDNDNIYSRDLNNGGADAPWISPNTGYRFTLWAVVPSGTSGSSQHTFQGQSFNVIELNEVWVTSGSLNCNTPPPSYNFNLAITPNPVCANTQSNVSITNASSGLNGKQV
ncbi:MAG: VCBS domain-containing protein, partial [Candidatus Doudnabacteria bacterium]|nr:VCBS domain-containing protein [Candidatus Doudnabacteria bacterium]